MKQNNKKRDKTFFYVMVAVDTLFCFQLVKLSKAFGSCDFNRESMWAREVIQKDH